MITLFSENVWQKAHNLLDEYVKDHSADCAAKLGGPWVKTAIFHGCQVIWHSWKIVVSQLCLAKFGCITGDSFFQIFVKIF